MTKVASIKKIFVFKKKKKQTIYKNSVERRNSKEIRE